MHIVVKNTQYLFWVGEGEEANPPPSRNALSYKGETLRLSVDTS